MQGAEAGLGPWHLFAPGIAGRASTVISTPPSGGWGVRKVLFQEKRDPPVYVPNPPNPRAFSASQKDFRVIFGLFSVIFRLFWVILGYSSA